MNRTQWRDKAISILRVMAEDGEFVAAFGEGGEHYAEFFVEAVNGNRIIDGGEDK